MWLNRYRQQSQELEYLWCELESLEDKATAAGVAKLTGTPNAPGHTSDRTGAIVGQLDELRAECAELQAEATATRHEIEAAIRKITAPRHHWADLRGVLRFRYIGLLSWNEVNYSLFGSKRDFLDREDSYLRRTTKLHSEAILILAEIMPALVAGKKGTNNDED